MDITSCGYEIFYQAQPSVCLLYTLHHDMWPGLTGLRFPYLDTVTDQILEVVKGWGYVVLQDIYIILPYTLYMMQVPTQISHAYSENNLNFKFSSYTNLSTVS